MRLQETIAAELVDIAIACCAATADQETLLVKTRDALANLPAEFREAFLPGFPSHDRFATLMRAGAHESAMIGLLGSKLGYMVSRSPNGIHLVTVCGPGLEDVAITTQSLALSLAAGLLTAVAVNCNGGCAIAPPGELARLN